MKKHTVAPAIIASLSLAIAPFAGARSVSYTGDGEGCGSSCQEVIWESCANRLDLQFLDVPFDRCAGVTRGHVSHVGDLGWCTYTLDEYSPLFTLVDGDESKGTLTFLRSLRGPLTLQFNGVSEVVLNGVPGVELFNVTFGFRQGFRRGEKIAFDFTAELNQWGEPAGNSGLVETVSIHVGSFDFAPRPNPAGAAGQDLDELMTLAQIQKCTYPGSPPGR